MFRVLYGFIAVACMVAAGQAHAATFVFDTDPFEGSDALTTPGRQIVGGESFIAFDPAADTFLFDPTAFGVSALNFFSGEAADIPASGVNLIVLLTTDNDADAATPFAAGVAANLIAAQITFDTPGFFIYFNSGLEVARLVFSTNLSDAGADLKILARLTNFAGAEGIVGLQTFTAGDFAFEDMQPVPLPPAIALFAAPFAFACAGRLRRLRSAAAKSVSVRG